MVSATINENGAKMPVLVYRRTDASRSIPYQNELLGPRIPDYENAKGFTDEDRDLMLRPSSRREQTIIYVASLALFADTENDMQEFLQCCKNRKIKLICAEEDLTWDGRIPLKTLLCYWRIARKAGAAMRGTIQSAATRKAATAAKLALIEDDLKRDEHTTRELLDRVGIKSVNSIKNHFGITREQMQGRYQAAQKRKERYEQRAN